MEAKLLTLVMQDTNMGLRGGSPTIGSRGYLGGSGEGSEIRIGLAKLF